MSAAEVFRLMIKTSTINTASTIQSIRVPGLTPSKLVISIVSGLICKRNEVDFRSAGGFKRKSHPWVASQSMRPHPG